MLLGLVTLGCGSSQPECRYRSEVGTVVITAWPRNAPPTTLPAGGQIPESQQTQARMELPAGHPALQFGTRQVLLRLPTCTGAPEDRAVALEGRYHYESRVLTSGACAPGTDGIVLEDGQPCVPAGVSAVVP